MIVSALRNRYPLKSLLSAVGLSRSVYYYQLQALKKPDRYAEVREMMHEIYHEHKGRYGYRPMHSALRKRGVQLCLNTVHKLMKEEGLKSIVRRKRKQYNHGNTNPKKPNVLNRDFKADKPNEKWVTDVTEFNVGGQRVYLSPVMDLYNQEIVHFTIGKNIRLPLVTTMIKEALSVLPESDKPLVHSDQGWQYSHPEYVQSLEKHDLIQSMSRKGNCWDNSVIENFFSILKTEMFNGVEFADADELIEAVKEYIVYYNTKRIKVGLGGLPPVEFREQALLNN